MRFLALAPVLFPSLALAQVALEPNASCFETLVRALSSDEMEGRGVGTDGLEKAAQAIAGWMDEAGLDDAGLPGHFQDFPVTTGVELDRGNSLSVGKHKYEVDEDWIPLGISSSGKFKGGLVFVGYGIRAKELGYDDYAGVDVKNKIVVALRYEPGEADENSPFDGKKPTRWSDRRYKAMVAREAGARALIFVELPREGGSETDGRLPRLLVDGPLAQSGIPVLQIQASMAQEWFDSAGLDLRALQGEIDSSYEPRSQALGVKIKGQVVVRATEQEVHNVVGVVPGAGTLAEEWVVVGAHYDHLGYGGHGSMRPDEHAIHNGADDNASGVAAMLCAAGQLTQTDKSGPRRSLLVLAFAAEEMGLGGSAWFTEHPVVELDTVRAMINLDMVGRVSEGKLRVLGTDSAPEWLEVFEGLGEAHGLSLLLGGDGYGPSDHMAFYTRGVPVAHLFSGAHADYHTPDDDADRLNMEGGGQVAALTADLLTVLRTRSEALTWVESAGGPPLHGDSRSSRAWMGTIPDYTAMDSEEGGVLLAGVREGGPAAVGGLTKGDVLVEMDGVAIQSLYDFTFALQDRKPGDVITVVVLRDGKPKRLAVTLGDRAKAPKGKSPHGHSSSDDWAPAAGKAVPELLNEQEVHLADLRQLTFGGENAEAYFSPDGRKLIFQRTPPEEGACDQQYEMDLNSGEVRLLSSGKGRTTCGYYAFPQGERYIYSTTEGGSEDCPPPPDRSEGYVWAIYKDYDMVWQENPESEPLPFLSSPGYDAEATACFETGRIVFTSVRDGDLELYTVKPDGSDLTRMTSTPGYDGGAFYTADCQHIVWRASRPQGEALKDYESLLEQGLVRPSVLEIYIMKADGTEVHQLTNNGAANFGPYATPDGEAVIYSSNAGGDPREFELFSVPTEGGEATQITFTPEFDGFPMFSPDGKWFVFGSNRGGTKHQTNLFIARWVD